MDCFPGEGNCYATTVPPPHTIKSYRRLHTIYLYGTQVEKTSNKLLSLSCVKEKNQGPSDDPMWCWPVCGELSHCLHPKWHPIPFIVHYFLPQPMHNRIHFVCCSSMWYSNTQRWCIGFPQCYKFIGDSDKKPWQEARTYCINQGGNLASVLSEKEQGGWEVHPFTPHCQSYLRHWHCPR